MPQLPREERHPQRIAMARRTRAQRRGQLWLSEEIRLAPFPIHTWPVELRQYGIV